MGASYYAKGASVSSPSTTEKTLTGLHSFSSTGWGMQQSSRGFRLEIIDGRPSSDLSSLRERRQQMRGIYLDSLHNSPVLEKQLLQELVSLYSSSTTEKNTNVQATSLGVTSISTISSSPVKALSVSHTVSKDNWLTDSTPFSVGAKSPATDSLRRNINNWYKNDYLGIKR